MKTIELADLPLRFVEWLLNAANTGKSLAVTVDGEVTGELTFEPAPDEPPLELSRSPRLREIIESSLESYQEQGGVALEDVKKLLREWEVEETKSASAG